MAGYDVERRLSMRTVEINGLIELKGYGVDKHMKDIKSYFTFTKIEPVNKGWSNDKKYYIETVDGKKRLLRVADISEYDSKKNEFEMMKQVALLGVQS